jgi:hypothetical protein
LDGHREDFSVPQMAVDISDHKVELLDTAVDISVRIRPAKITNERPLR